MATFDIGYLKVCQKSRLYPYLNGDGDVVLPAEAKADHQVGNDLPGPVGADQVDGCQALQGERLIVIERAKIRGCAVREVVDVV